MHTVEKETLPLSSLDDQAADDLAAGLQGVEDLVAGIETQLCDTLTELARLRRKGADVESLERAISGAVGCLRERRDDVVSENDSPSPMQQQELRPALRRPVSGLSQTQTGARSAFRQDGEIRAATVTLGGHRQKKVEPLVGLCNPLLDMSLRVDEAFLKKYGLAADGWAAATDETLCIFNMLAGNPATQYIPGGSGLNTLRVAQWIIDIPGATTFLGTTSPDDFGARLHDATEAEGVRFPKIETESERTGTCAVLLNGDCRSLVANLGAGGLFRAHWLRERPDLQRIVQNAGLYYVTGFFLRTSPETVADLAAMASVRGRELVLNMSASFVCTANVQLFRDILPRVDLLFGNAEEALALVEALAGLDRKQAPVDEGLQAKDAAARLQRLQKFGNPRTVVITQGPNSVVIATQTGVESYDTAPLPAEHVVDTNGAGDAFAGGFLAKRLQGGSVAECVRVGQWAAATIIGQVGCTLPNISPGLLPAPPGRRRLSVVSAAEPGGRLAASRPSLGSPSLKAFDTSRHSLGETFSRFRYSVVMTGSSVRGESPPGSVTEPANLVGFCNPLLDMALHVEEGFLERYKLARDGWTAADQDTMPIFAEMAADQRTQYLPGGSGLNTLRVAQWILEVPGAATFVGATGKDEFGRRLHEATESEGVNFPSIDLDELPTGTCAVLLNGDCRSLVANLGASGVFDAAWLQDRPDVKAAIDAAGVFYATGFFLRTSPEAVSYLAHVASTKDCDLCLNLSAPFVCEGSVQLFRDALPSVDLLFGNAAEATALARALGADASDTHSVARRLQQMPKANLNKPRVVVVTQGAGPVIVAKDDGVVTYETSRLPPDDVVDTNGAGDAFAGGFLAKRAQGGSVAECVRVGQWAATIIIGQPGCTLPPLPPGQLPGFFDEQESDSPTYVGREKSGLSVRTKRSRRLSVDPTQPHSSALLAPIGGVNRRPSMGVSLKIVAQLSTPSSKGSEAWSRVRNAVTATSLMKALSPRSRSALEESLRPLEGTTSPPPDV